MDKLTVVDYNGEAQDYSVRDMLYVDETNYQTEYLKQPAMYAYWSSVLQEAKRVQSEQENQLEKTHAELYNTAYNKLKDEGIKPTKDLIEAQIEQSDDYYIAKQRVDTATYSAGRITFLVKALEQRASMLQSFGADQRKDKTFGN